MSLPGQKNILVLTFLLLYIGSFAQNQLISFSKEKQSFSFAANGVVKPIVISENEYPRVLRIARLFQDDIFQVTSIKPELIVGELSKSETVIIAGTLGKSELIDPGVVLQKVVVQTGNKKETYLGEPESVNLNNKNK